MNDAHDLTRPGPEARRISVHFSFPGVEIRTQRVEIIRFASTHIFSTQKHNFSNFCMFRCCGKLILNNFCNPVGSWWLLSDRRTDGLASTSYFFHPKPLLVDLLDCSMLWKVDFRQFWSSSWLLVGGFYLTDGCTASRTEDRTDDRKIERTNDRTDDRTDGRSSVRLFGNHMFLL